jgi:hypothetical protein
MAKTLPTVYNEQFGDITRPQQAAYRKHNVSPSDHDTLVDIFGEGEHAKITEYVKTNSTTGIYRLPMQDRFRN